MMLCEYGPNFLTTTTTNNNTNNNTNNTPSLSLSLSLFSHLLETPPEQAFLKMVIHAAMLSLVSAHTPVVFLGSAM